ncbi:MAG: dienelactone hydrolase family protein [Actinobacteria bacterium]|nr:dienelactone hydrolase family protein [Actinomycetota bacterium]
MATTTDIDIALPGGTAFRGALALPDQHGPAAGVIVLHEAFGLNGDIRRIAGRFAENGYAALAPDLYSHGSRTLCMVRMLAGGLQDQALGDIEAARVALAARPEVDAERIGVVGFCMGGGFALLFGAQGGVKVAGVNYGRVPKDRGELANVCPVVAGYGKKDRPFLSHAERLEAHLTALVVDHDVKLYENVGHSFMSYDNGPAWMMRVPSPMHVGYSEPEAEDAWRRILDFFGRYLTPA